MPSPLKPTNFLLLTGRWNPARGSKLCRCEHIASKDNRIPVLELPFQQAGSAQLSGTSRSNDLHNHSRHTARTNTNTSAATMIQINAGSFSYMAAGQYAAIGRCLWKWERPRQEVEPAPGPPLPNLHLWGVQVGRNGETPARTLQFLCAPEHSSVTGRAAGQRPVGRGPQACFAKPNIGVALLGATKGRKY